MSRTSLLKAALLPNRNLLGVKLILRVSLPARRLSNSSSSAIMSGMLAEVEGRPLFFDRPCDCD